MPAAALRLLKRIETITACRDRSVLGRVTLQALAVLLGDRADVALFRRDMHGETSLVQHLGPGCATLLRDAWWDLLEQARNVEQIVSVTVEKVRYGAFLLQHSEIGIEQFLLTFATHVSSDFDDEGIAGVARIYGNQIKLLDYSELDSLTRLLNRKTFDETFDRLLLAGADAADPASEDLRQHAGAADPAWLGVIDIDHFKRVNDSFGHLFGDEVLIRVGDLLRKNFRHGDRLFRFGGEEFVVILNAENEGLAAAGFNRFRIAVEECEFPQVGQVTCSIGFTAVSSTDVPTGVVGRADEALYYAKSHGRNQVCDYESLLASGAIAAPTVTEAPVSDFDIDALFE